MQSARSTGSDPESQAHGVMGKFQRLQGDGAATAAELKSFLAGMKDKSPQEMLGAIAQSGLIVSTLAATGVIAVLMVAFTVGPYLVYGPPVDLKDAIKKAEAASAQQAENSSNDNNAENPTSADSVAGTDGQPNVNGDQLNKVLGIDEAKVVDPKKNPLDIDDDLLKIKD